MKKAANSVELMELYEVAKTVESLGIHLVVCLADTMVVNSVVLTVEKSVALKEIRLVAKMVVCLVDSSALNRAVTKVVN